MNGNKTQKYQQHKMAMAMFDLLQMYNHIMKTESTSTYLSRDTMEMILNYMWETHTIIVHETPITHRRFGREMYLCKTGALTEDEAHFLAGVRIHGFFWLSRDIVDVFRKIQTCPLGRLKHPTDQHREAFIDRKTKEYSHLCGVYTMGRINGVARAQYRLQPETIKTILREKLMGRSKWRIIKKKDIAKLGPRVKMIRKIINRF